MDGKVVNLGGFVPLFTRMVYLWVLLWFEIVDYISIYFLFWKPVFTAAYAGLPIEGKEFSWSLKPMAIIKIKTALNYESDIKAGSLLDRLQGSSLWWLRLLAISFNGEVSWLPKAWWTLWLAKMFMSIQQTWQLIQFNQDLHFVSLTGLASPILH